MNLSTPWVRWHLGEAFRVNPMGKMAVNVLNTDIRQWTTTILIGLIELSNDNTWNEKNQHCIIVHLNDERDVKLVDCYFITVLKYCQQDQLKHNA